MSEFSPRGARRLAAALTVIAPLVLFASARSPTPQIAQAAAPDYMRGDLTYLTDGARVDWSQDGATIYFDRAAGAGYFDVWRMDQDGSDQSCLTCGHAQLPNRHQGNPEMHPGGRYLVFQAEKAQHAATAAWLPEPGIGRFNDLWVLDLQTMAAYQLTNVSATGVAGVLHPQFNSDGSRLLWSHIEGATAEFDDMALAVADFETSPQPHLENTVYYNPGPDPGWMETHGWGADDSWVYVSCTPVAGMGDTSMDTCRMDFADPTQVTRLNFTSGQNGEPAEWDEHAHLSPAGDAFVWMSSQPYGTVSGDIVQIGQTLKTDLWIMDTAGGNERRLTYFNAPGHPDSTGDRAIASELDWAPDGTRLVVRVQFPDWAQRDRIYLLDLCADADANTVCDVAESPYPADAVGVQTDTIRAEDDLLFTSVRYLPSQPPAGQAWRPEVFAMDTDTLLYHRLTYMDDQYMRHMAASPDHRKMAMTRIPKDTNGDTALDEQDDQRVWIVDLEGGKAWPLTEAGATAGAGGVDWLDNQTVVFNYKPPGPGLYDLAKADYLTKARTGLTNTPTIAESDAGASADGSLIAYVAVDTGEVLGTDQFGPILKSKIWLRNADGSNPRQVTDGGPLVGRAGPLSAGDYDPELSSDNTWVAFGRAVALGTNDINPDDGVPGAGTHRIFAADVSTLAITELTQNASVALIPDWAGDGTIYFSEIAITAEHSANPYLGIATTTESGGLTRLEPFAPQDMWKGALVTKLIPAALTPADGDGDGWTAAEETYIYSESSPNHDQGRCGDGTGPDGSSSGWPGDLDGNGSMGGGDINSFLFPLRGDLSFNKFGHPAGEGPVTKRWDLDLSGAVGGGDLNALNPGVTASTSRPPMFAGQVAFGRVCP